MDSEEILMLNRVHELSGCLCGINNVSFPWLLRDSLSADLLTLFLGFSLLGIVLSYSCFEGLSDIALTNVFNSHMDSLGNDSGTNSFVNDDTDGFLVDIEDDTCLSVVEFVWHTFVDGTISNNINVVSLSVSYHYSRKRDSSVFLKAL